MKKALLLLLLWGVCLQYCYSQSQPLPIEKLIEVFNNPINYPNYIMISAHRGYWKDLSGKFSACYTSCNRFGSGYGRI